MIYNDILLGTKEKTAYIFSFNRLVAYNPTYPGGYSLCGNIGVPTPSCIAWNFRAYATLTSS